MVRRRSSATLPRHTAERAFDESANQTSAPPGAIFIRATGVAPGSYRGSARVINDEHDIERVQPGDVLVCRAATLPYVARFPKLGALITETGGALSSAATIARECGIPAVMATGNATKIIRDGQPVLVDGTHGIVLAQP